MNEADFAKVEKAVFLSSIVLATLGIVEISVGRTSNSIGLVADGIDSMSDAAVSVFVGLGLKVSRRRPDKKFHFGYHRVETLASMVVAVAMLAMSAIIFYNAYRRIMNPEEITYPVMGMITLAGAGTASVIMAVMKNKLAAKYNLLSLKADAKNSIKDGSASFIVLIGVFLAYLGFGWGDPAGAMIVGVYIVFVAVTTIKQASLVLIDAFNNTEMLKEIEGIVKKYPLVKLQDTRLRMSGPYVVGEVLVAADPDMSVGELFKIKEKIKAEVRRKIDGVGDLTVSAEPPGARGANGSYMHYDYLTNGRYSISSKALNVLEDIEKKSPFYRDGK